ncbi:Uncharacterised protein [Yokenella regensburgei]|nr:Uncharacterised protein [Yokenella regensburgei]
MARAKINVLPRRQFAAVLLKLTFRAELQVVITDQLATVQGNAALACNRDIAARFMIARKRNLLPFRLNSAAGKALVHAELAAGIKGDIPLTRIKIAKVNPDAFLARHQTDPVGVHAAERAGIDRHRRRITFTLLRLNAAVCANAVRPGHHPQIFSVHLGVNFRGPGDYRQRVAAAGINPFAFDGDCAFSDIQRLQVAVGIKHRFTGRQSSVRCVDKSAAIAGYAVGVRDHHVCRFPRHFRHPLQLRAVAAGHFVDDGLRFLPWSEIGVAGNDPAKLGLIELVGGVVEDDPFFSDVIVLELVMGDSRPVRRGDIHHRHAVGRAVHAGWPLRG